MLPFRQYTTQGLWPPSPPDYVKDPVVKKQADEIYSQVLSRYRQLVKMKPEQIKDPWSKNEEWRYHPYFGSVNIIKHAFPGLSWALAAFVGYCAYEKYVM